MNSIQNRDHPIGLRVAYARSRAVMVSGGVVTNYFSNELGALIAAIALRRGVHPTVLTWGNVVCAATGTAPILAGLASPGPLWGPGWIAVVFWPLAYAFDCADGQVARVSGRTSEYGARVDVLGDYASHIIVMAGALAGSRLVSVPLAVVAAGMWLFGTVASSLRKADVEASHSLTSGGPLSLMVKSAADTGFVTLVVGVWVLAAPSSAGVPVLAYAAVNAVYFCAMIVRESRLSVRASRK